MISGHLQKKNDRYYMVLSLKNEDGKWKPKWIKTGLQVKGNKKRAEQMLRDTIAEYEVKEARDSSHADCIDFADYMLNWLEIIRNSVELSTFSSYRQYVKNQIVPYFREHPVTLAELEQNPQLIQEYYNYRMVVVGNKATSIHRHHANIRKALQRAVKIGLIASNPADKVERPRQQPFHASFYDVDTLNRLLEIAQGTWLYLPVLIASFYGLRRSEVMGLKWSAVNFKNKTISIQHTINKAIDEDGKTFIYAKDRTKNTTSRRTLPLIPQVEKALLEKQASDAEFRRVCGRSYSKEYLEYILVDELGRLYNPETLSKSFPRLLEQNHMSHIRFHDLRHSCASLLLNNGVQMKAIQEWLGHSNFATTANLYAHLDAENKKESALIVGNALQLSTPKEPEQKKDEIAPASTA